ncbi:MAG: GNAT family N-acetyltransferase [Clostridia bacterium]|nr:GNAT family N-acetyltransferase [Clostridia bacterium]
MDICRLSGRYGVRRLGREDIGAVYELCRGNPLFYRYHPPFVTKESILADMSALPPGKGYEDKHYVGFFEGEGLVAVLDLIEGYPTPSTAYIGFFMTEASVQGSGVGTAIVSELAKALKGFGFERIRLGADGDNPQSVAFWRKNGFSAVEEKDFLVMERIL